MEDHIRQLNRDNIVLLVEGKHDLESLQKLGVTSPILTINKAHYEIVEDICENFSGYTVVILTDLDAAGKRLYGRFRRMLSERGVRMDDAFREYLFCETALWQIEGLYAYAVRKGLIQ